MGHRNSRSGRSIFRSVVPVGQSGQIILEYVLLLVVSVGIAALIVSSLAARDIDNPGIIIRKWCEIQKLIKDDNPGNRGASPAATGCG